MCVNKCIQIQIRVCPNQDRRSSHVSLPTKLRNKWAAHIGDDNPRKQFQYSVTIAVRQGKSNHDHFEKCWQLYKRRAKNIGEQYFLDDVFRRFCDADFTKQRGDNSKSKLAFVLRILEEYDEYKSSQVSHEFDGWLVFMHCCNACA